MNETVPIYAFVVLFVLSIGAIAVAKIINTKSVLGETPDFITAAIRRRREKLGEYTTGVTFRIYCFLLIALPIIFGAAGFLLSNSGAIALIAGLLGVFIPDLIIVLTAKRQGKKFETRYARCLKALTSCLRTTMSISQAVEDVAKNPFLDAKSGPALNRSARISRWGSLRKRRSRGLPTEPAARMHRMLRRPSACRCGWAAARQRSWNP